jgi:hypothetical protein
MLFIVIALLLLLLSIVLLLACEPHQLSLILLVYRVHIVLTGGYHFYHITKAFAMHYISI